MILRFVIGTYANIDLIFICNRIIKRPVQTVFICQMKYFTDGISETTYTSSNLVPGVFETVKSQNFSIINHNYRSPIMIVTLMCTSFVIREIYGNGLLSVKVVLPHIYVFWAKIY